ncbi:hypothetical protein TVAG_090830 [Trichomonas vaginalis G3]|uniref:Bromo domain-containing protein n=1 Tax=Trichomonas vaginalis (strain ATCC PRA-98 / G3) TaxID=412133 RepID=A2F920_TRIV3|nr:hypothetical protein TVAGG3_0828020 [Trichomonas vaginalis G3]EAX98595.1 hypothetical protein TVAG_090830 [Trichomonas vaginalis G3]KAI5498384.1 hypothetical protein TVAGG3_0828020 [Trichomonas vaginalis G3]|eukprot:XP_001311525.1 hypothetical protein [Trichomonas vaginalis G3]
MDSELNPTIRKLAINVMDDLLARPMILILSEREKYNDGPLSQIRQELTNKKFPNISAWEKAVVDVFRDKKFSEDEVLRDVAYEMETYFNQKCELLNELSAFHFKDLLQNISDTIKENNPDLLAEK